MRVALVVSVVAFICALALGQNTSAQTPAPVTAQQYEALMKKIGPAYQSLRKQLQANDAKGAANDAEQLGELFGDVERFWAQHKREDALKWTKLARNRASDVSGAAATGNVKKAAAAAENMGAACKQCHGTYRESDGAGGYRMKAGVITRP